MENKKSLGSYIRTKRTERGLTQKDFADQLYVTESAVSKWERGVSYPDITLMSNICDVLKISERELITASDDFRQREMELQAKRLQKMIRIWLWIMNVSYGISLVACFICNLAIDHTLSWFFIVLTAEMTAFTLTSLPFLLKKNRGLITLISFFITLTLLLWVCSLYTGGSWFLVSFAGILLGMVVVFLPFAIRGIRLPAAISHHKALICVAVDTLLLILLVAVSSIYTGQTAVLLTIWLPVTGVGLILPWLFLLVIRYLKINALFKTSICLVISGFFELFCNSMLSVIIDGKPFRLMYNFTRWTEEYIDGNIKLLIAVICIVAALIFAAGGIEIVKKQKK